MYTVVVLGVILREDIQGLVVFSSATFEALGLQPELDVWLETHAKSSFIYESFFNVTVGGYSGVWTVVVGFIVPEDSVEDGLYKTK